MSKHPDAGSQLLLLFTLAALVIANSPISGLYAEVFHHPVLFRVMDQNFPVTLHHVINDGLMTFFFLMIGLELKRELVSGQLASIRRAALPILAAIGGMVVPACFYFYLNPTGTAASGWGIPMATDIAFAIGALALLGNRVPRSLIVFLLAIAIVDDLGAILVIAFFYTQSLNWLMLFICALLTALLLLLNYRGVQNILLYLLVGLVLWCAMLFSGVHATIAGVILAFCIPTSSVKKLEHKLHWPVSFLVVPLFAFANAGIAIPLSSISTQIVNPITLGVICGLVFGKVMGISGATWLSLKIKLTELPHHLDMRHIIGVSLLGGIGFTMSIFIAELGFSSYPQELLMAKTGILFASAIAGFSGVCWLRFCEKADTFDV